MRHRKFRKGVCLSLTLCAAAAAGASLSPAAPRRAAHQLFCIGPSKKSLTDHDASQVNLTPVASTVAALRALPVPANAGPGMPRTAPEKTTYRLTVRLVAAKLQDDQDIHLVVADPAGSGTMITEFPDPTCPVAARSPVVAQMAAARQALFRSIGPVGNTWRLLGGTAEMTGVGFFDSVHGQRGVAPNGIELHPVLSFSNFRPARRPGLAILYWSAKRRGGWYAERARVRLCAPPGHAYPARVVERSFPREHTVIIPRPLPHPVTCTTYILNWRFPAGPGQRRHRLTLTVKTRGLELVARASRP